MIMPFRAHESAVSGYEKTKNYLIPRSFTPAQRRQAEETLRNIVEECGPPVDAYPTWHPLVSNYDSSRDTVTYPSERCGYRGLDHTRYFAHGFITCPYDDGEEVLRSATSLPYTPGVSISAERLDTPFYAGGVTPILVKCEWVDGLDEDQAIPKRMAIPLMLEKEVPCWRWAQRAETWETMRPYLLGEPHGSRSSLFVSQDTALAIKRIYLAMTDSGMFGPLKL
jgi:hypothetical protein